MCNFFSCVLVHEDFFGLGNKYKVFYNPNDNSHETIIDDNHLRDTTIKNRKFIRFEISPRAGIFNMNRGNWHFKIDEAKTLPSWYENHTKRCDEMVWGAWEEMLTKINSLLVDPLTKPEYQEFITLKERYYDLRDKNKSAMIIDKLNDINNNREHLCPSINRIFKNYCQTNNIMSIYPSLGCIKSAYTIEDDAIIELRNEYKDCFVEMIKILEDANRV